MLPTFRTASLVLIASCAAALVALSARSIDSEHDQQYRLQLRRARELDAHLHGELFKSRTGMVNHYDPVVGHLAELRAIERQLDDVPEFVEGRAREELLAELGAYRSLLDEQEKLVERFKTENAVLRNSARYFPVASDDLTRSLAHEPGGRELAASVHKLSGDVLLILTFRDPDHLTRTKDDIEGLRKLIDRSAASEADGLRALLDHADEIVERKPRVDVVVSEILALATGPQIERVFSSYTRRYEQAAADWRLLRILVFVLAACAAAAGAVYIILRLKRSAAALTVAKGELEHALVELRAEQDKQKELAELKSRFVSMASHEFRTPLSVILSSAELLDVYGERWSAEKKKSHFERMQTAAKGMKAMLDDVLVVGKAESGAFDCKPAPTDLPHFCEDVVESVTGAINGHHHMIFEAEGDLQTVSVDPRLLEHALSNLLSNAMKYSPPGSTVRLALRRQGDEAIFEIRDSGIGIRKEDQARLFESFFRGGNVGGISGTGLGLAIAKKAVDAHGGHIEVESEIGVGTRFLVRVPLQGVT